MHERGFLRQGYLYLVMSVLVVGGMTVNAQGPDTRVIDAAEGAETFEHVTINVRDADIGEVLKAYSLQTGQSIVIGPEVISESVNLRLNNIPWEEALDVILKPYGFGYRVVGDTIVVSKLENIVTVEGIEPLASRVFRLKYLDAYDIEEVCKAQLSPRGSMTILTTKSLPGWEFGGSGSQGAATDAGIRRRREKQDINKSKVFVVADVPSAVTKVERILEEMDVMPKQVLIEARFMEISTEGLKDLGLEYASAVENLAELAVTSELSPVPIDASENIQRVLNLASGYADPLATRAAGSYSFGNGFRLSHTEVGGSSIDALFAFMEQSDDVNMLSAPRILTQNNQESAILVGQKFPIIESESTSGGGSGVTSTSLDYYENIGIQLNVIPQVCDGNFVNMIVHPAVSEIKGFEAGVVTADSGSQSGSRYPVLNIREAETQVMIKSANTAVIGGLQSERTTEMVKKVPVLGDLPFIGKLFRRETTTSEKVDLLIFIKASIIANEEYETTSIEAEAAREADMDVDPAFRVHAPADEPTDAPADEPAAVESNLLNEQDGKEVVSLIEQMDAAATNQAAGVTL